MLDKTCATLLANYLETSGMLDSRQFGFHPNHSIIDALHSGVRFISESKRIGQYTCLINLNIKNVFNSARTTDLIRLLAEYDGPSTLPWANLLAYSDA